MKLTYLAATAASVVFAAGVFAADAAKAHPPGGHDRNVRVIVNGPHVGIDFGAIDANKDGFVSRDEMRVEAERQFAALDTESDGKVVVPTRGPRMESRTETRTVIVTRGPDGATTRVERDDDDDRAMPRPPRPPRPPGPPIMMMLFAHSGEADLNGDGALSKDEFVNQQLRFFDAADANRDGKVKFDPPPVTMIDIPEPPEAPMPPAPPRR